MIKYTIIEPEDLLILEPDAPLKATDFDFLAEHLDPYLAKQGKLPGLMIYAKKFPGWENLAAFTAHIRFVKDHLKRVTRIAMVTDSAILTDVSRVADHLTEAEVKQFAFASYHEALFWLRERAEPPFVKGEAV